jgi:hypothetical protein
VPTETQVLTPSEAAAWMDGYYTAFLGATCRDAKEALRLRMDRLAIDQREAGHSIRSAMLGKEA